jgi:hypothetical protein
MPISAQRTQATSPAAARMLEDADRATYASRSGGRARHTIHVPEGPEGAMH